jgi:FkbM family methyltransferase
MDESDYYFDWGSTKKNFSLVKNIKNVCKNPYLIFLKIIFKRFPMVVMFLDSTKVRVQNLYDLVFLCTDNAWQFCEIKDDILFINYNSKKIAFSDWRKNGDIGKIFGEEIYKSLPVKDNIVVDVGTNIGDSILYFSLRGAQKIIGIEPVKANYDSAKKNIKINNIKNVELILAGCAGKNHKMKIDSNKISNGPLTANPDGTEILFISLEELCKNHNIISGILKLDCEGYEHEIITSTNKEILSKFRYIYAELHFKSKKRVNEIKNHLEKNGFVVSLLGKLGNTDMPQYLEAKQIS